MAKPLIHAESSRKRWGGDIEDYLPIHDRMDSSKSVMAEVTHRTVFHSAFGIFIIEDIFGHFIVNSDQKRISVRDIAEQHVMEDLGCIPSLYEWMKDVEIKTWMTGTRKQGVKFAD